MDKLKLRQSVTAENFDRHFYEMWKHGGAKGVVKARFDMLGLRHGTRSQYALDYTKSLGTAEAVVYKIKYWCSEAELESVLAKYQEEHVITQRTKYLGEEEPGILYIESRSLNTALFSELLVREFNKDFSIEPSLSIVVQLYLELPQRSLLLDFYDDRGFDQYEIVAKKVGSAGVYQT